MHLYPAGGRGPAHSLGAQRCLRTAPKIDLMPAGTAERIPLASAGVSL